MREHARLWTAVGSDPRACPTCSGGRLTLKLSKFGAFIGCSNYPECRYTRALSSQADGSPDIGTKKLGVDPVSGLDVTRWIKNDPQLAAIPVVAVTAFAMKGDEERIRQGGCEAYLSKPISVGKFIETIRQFIG